MAVYRDGVVGSAPPAPGPAPHLVHLQARRHPRQQQVLGCHLQLPAGPPQARQQRLDAPRFMAKIWRSTSGGRSALEGACECCGGVAVRPRQSNTVCYPAELGHDSGVRGVTWCCMA